MTSKPQTSYPAAFLAGFTEKLSDFFDFRDIFYDQVEDLEAYLAESNAEALRTEPAYQQEFTEYHSTIMEYMDLTLLHLNYFLTMEDQLPAIRQALKGKLGQFGSEIAIIHDADAMRREVQDIIDTGFENLTLLRSYFSEETKNDRAGDMDSYPFAHEIGMDSGEVEKDDMPNKMELLFWLEYTRRLQLYCVTEDMATWLDEQESDPENRVDQVGQIISGEMAEIFPPSFINLDQYSADEIERARDVYDITEETPAAPPQQHTAQIIRLDFGK